MRALGGLLAAIALLAATTAAAGSAEQQGDPLLRYQWHLRAIQAPAAWPISRGEGATVAVLDTGVAYEDRGPYRRAPDLGGVRIVAGWDFVAGDRHPDDVPPPRSRRSHGTQIATIIAAAAGNRVGGAGVAPKAAIMPIRVLEPDRSGSARTIARGLRFAADHGADVANLSIAGLSRSAVLDDAVDYAYARGVTIVAAAGNDGRPVVSWPAADPKVIAVGAVTRGGARASYSNYGPQLDLVAPGGAGERVDTGYGPGDGVLSQTLKGGPAEFCFCFTASTSAAAAQVSGVAALLVGSGRATTPAAVRAALTTGARDLGARGRDDEYGAGLVQARSALEGDRAPQVPGRGDGSPGSTPSAWLVAVLAGVVIAGAGALARARRRGRAARS